MSKINTGAIDSNYPIAGVKNTSQGFRDNFSSIKKNLDIAKTEITELQNNVVVKSPLDGVTLNNDMSGTLISNALVQGFRATTNNLGNNLTGVISIDVTKGDVQYGTVTGDSQLGFSKWGPAGTQSSVDVILTVPEQYANSVITLPTNIGNSKITLENYTSNAVTTANGVTQLHYTFSTLDSGANVSVEPINRPRKATQITTSVPATSIGRPGDRPGACAQGSGYLYVCTGVYDGTTSIWKRVTLDYWV